MTPLPFPFFIKRFELNKRRATSNLEKKKSDMMSQMFRVLVSRIKKHPPCPSPDSMPVI